VLEAVNQNLKPRQQLETKASVLWPTKDVPKKHGTNRLIFQVLRAPARVVLFDVAGRDQIREIADRLKSMWLPL
jgi:hypothetical protein